MRYDVHIADCAVNDVLRCSAVALYFRANVDPIALGKVDFPGVHLGGTRRPNRVVARAPYGLRTAETPSLGLNTSCKLDRPL